MADDVDRRTILDRANRMMRQSRTLRKVADELLQESNDLRRATGKKSRRTKSNQRKGPKD